MSRAATIPQVNGDGWLSSLKLTRAYLSDPLGVIRAIHARHGPVARMNLFGMQAIVLLGVTANERVLMNRDGAFSSELGWEPVIGMTFPQGLISLDGPRHRDDRRMIGAAFRSEPMRHYLDAMAGQIARDLKSWPERLVFYPSVKRLTLELAATCLLGLPLGPRADRMSRAFVTMLGASTAFVRRPIPPGAMWRGIRARDRLSAFLASEIMLRRKRPGPDIFSTICGMIDDSGAPLPDDAIVRHINLLMMAAHDTTTSALTSIVYLLGRHPDWQEHVREELIEWRTRGTLDQEGLRSLSTTDMVLSEALRLMPPVPSLPRGLANDVEFHGYVLPKGASAGIHILHTHHSPDHWPEPDRFDPLRFTPDQVRARHKYAWLPFGGGAHTCIGLHFASMQVKLVLAELLCGRRIVLDDGYRPAMQWLPIARPQDGLQVRLKPL